MMNFTRQIFLFELALLVCLCHKVCAELSKKLDRNSGGNVACKDACRQQFAGHPFTLKEAYQGLLEDSCQRGCRFYAIVELLDKSADHAHTLTSCNKNCHDAYLSLHQETEACSSGCQHQHPFKMMKSKLPLVNPPARGKENIVSVLYPVVQIHNLYKSVRKVSWSFFAVQDETGHAGDLVIVETEPLQHRVFSKEDRPYPGISASFGNPSRKGHTSFSAVSWLTCSPQSPGMLGNFLLVLFLLPSMALVWLCFTAAETAPDHHVKLPVQMDAVEVLELEENSCKKFPIMDTDSPMLELGAPLPSKLTQDKL